MMDDKIKRDIMTRAGEMLDGDWHCSEALLAAVGEHYLKDVSPEMVRMSTPFAGGVGCTHAELCGALTGGLMVIGGLYGRAEAGVNDDECQKLAAEYRARFLKEFGTLKCQDLKDNWVRREGQESCRALVERAAGVLMDVLGAQTETGFRR